MREEILGIAEYSVTPNSSLGLAFLDVGIQFINASIMNTFIINWVWEPERLKFEFLLGHLLAVDLGSII